MKIDNLEFDETTLELIHCLKETNFLPLVQEVFPHAKFLRTPDYRQLIYVDNKSPILSVAHLDGTMPASHFAWGRHYSKPKDVCIFSPYVDDRLGAYTLLYLLPQLKINCDILLSVGEEQGNPTSQFYEPSKKYNWMFQFDRMGEDAVHYQYMEQAWLTALTKHFGKIYTGSFSDIVYLDHLDVCGVNIGTGYHDYTGKGAWASLNELTSQVNKFKKFYDEYKDRHFPFEMSSKWWEKYFGETKHLWE